SDGRGDYQRQEADFAGDRLPRGRIRATRRLRRCPGGPGGQRRRTGAGDRPDSRRTGGLPTLGRRGAWASLPAQLVLVAFVARAYKKGCLLTSERAAFFRVSCPFPDGGSQRAAILWGPRHRIRGR